MIGHPIASGFMFCPLLPLWFPHFILYTRLNIWVLEDYHSLLPSAEVENEQSFTISYLFQVTAHIIIKKDLLYTDGTGFHTCKECHKTKSLWNHTTTDHKEGEQLEDWRSVGASSCNCGDGTDQRVQSLMFMMMICYIVIFLLHVLAPESHLQGE